MHEDWYRGGVGSRAMCRVRQEGPLSAALTGQGTVQAGLAPARQPGWAQLGLTAPPGGGCLHMPYIRGQKSQPRADCVAGAAGFGLLLLGKVEALQLGSLLGLVGASLPLSAQGFCEAAF